MLAPTRCSLWCYSQAPTTATGIIDTPPPKRQPTLELMELSGYKAIEETCGGRYRTGVSDQVLGIGEPDVKAKLES